MIMRNKGSQLIASVSLAVLSLLFGGAVVAQNMPNGGMNVTFSQKTGQFEA